MDLGSVYSIVKEHSGLHGGGTTLVIRSEK